MVRGFVLFSTLGVIGGGVETVVLISKFHKANELHWLCPMIYLECLGVHKHNENLLKITCYT